MKLAPIVAELRRRCPSFEQRVYGSVEFSSIEATTNLAMPCAFVLPLGESTGERYSQNEYRQPVEQSVGVVVFVQATTDRTGLDAYDFVEGIKAEILKAIVGWEANCEHDELEYDGMSILEFNRARLAVQMEFTWPYDIVDEETRHGVDIASLPDLTEVALNVDLMAPDGRNEAKALFNLNGGKS